MNKKTNLKDWLINFEDTAMTKKEEKKDKTNQWKEESKRKRGKPRIQLLETKELIYQKDKNK